MTKKGRKLIEIFEYAANRDGDYYTADGDTAKACDAARDKLIAYVEKLEDIVSTSIDHQPTKGTGWAGC